MVAIEVHTSYLFSRSAVSGDLHELVNDKSRNSKGQMASNSSNWPQSKIETDVLRPLVE